MKYKELGSTGFGVSVLGLGSIGAGTRSSATRESIDCRVKIVRDAVDLGINFFDTGEDYENGHAEELLGKALSSCRHKVVISSKFMPQNNSYDRVIRAAEGSLFRLNTDYIDLYQLHWPNPRIPIEETMRALSMLVKQGKVRYVGLSNMSIEQIEIAQEAFAEDKIVSLQTEYNLRCRASAEKLLDHCQKKQMTFIAYGPLNQGRPFFDLPGAEVLTELADKHMVTVAQLIFAWIVSKEPAIVLTQTMKFDHLKENAAAVNIDLPAADIKRIDAIQNHKAELIMPDKIRVLASDLDQAHIIYTTLDQAVKNEKGVDPSPAMLADEIRQGMLLRPIEVVRIPVDKDGVEYELVQGRMRYWAWIIANGWDLPIPAYVLRR